jgi:hypothetical protein
MAHVQGAIQAGEQTILDQAEIMLEEADDINLGLHEWQGSFTVPAGVTIEPEEVYRLVLPDGRAGNILITGFDAAEGVAQFDGTGDER